MYQRAFSPEQRKVRYVQEVHLNVAPTSALMLILPEKYPEHVQFTFCAGVYCIVVFVSILLIALWIRKILAQCVQLSKQSVDLHRMLLRSLIWQAMVPFFFIFVPSVLLILSVTSKNIFVEGAETPYYARLFAAISLCILSFYSIAHVIVMTTFTKPYRHFIVRLLCRTRSAKVLVVSFSGTIPTVKIDAPF